VVEEEVEYLVVKSGSNGSKRAFIGFLQDG
jgi:hypothetical protein